jgi:uncharacterized protein (TIGR03435 family)
MRRITLAALILFAPSALLVAQSPAPAAFEVASIKLDPKQDRGIGRRMAEITLPIVRVQPGGRVESYGHTLRNLIAVAYDINSLMQKLEGKQEVLETVFIIEAKAAAPSVTPAEAKAMVRTLLEDRFQLRLRRQPREVDGYLLMPARDDGRPGPALRAFTGDCAARASNVGVRFDSPEYEQNARCGWSGMLGKQRGIGVSMTTVADQLKAMMVAPVSDRTGWPGLFTFDIDADTGDMPVTALLPRPPGLGAPRPVDAPQLLDAFRQELGLKLVKERVMIDDFIIERLEPLIEN